MPEQHTGMVTITFMHGHNYTQTNILTDTLRHLDKHTDIHAYRQTHTQTDTLDTLTDTHTKNSEYSG